MIEISKNTPSRSVGSELLILSGFFLIGLVLSEGMVLGFFKMASIFSGKTINLTNLAENPANSPYILIGQGIYSLVAFIIVPLLYLRFIENRGFSSLSPNRKIAYVPVILVIMLVIFSMQFNSWVYYWNRQIDLAKWMGSAGAMFRKLEESAESLTKSLTQFKTFADFLLALVVIGILPAVGEELMFRGVLQSKILHLTKNIHVAVWITGFIFSFIHFQLYGLFPRWILGVMFGYLYVWSGNIIYPMLAHFVNNGSQVLILYLFQQKVIKTDIDAVDYVQWQQGVFSLGLTVILLISFRGYYIRKMSEQ